MPFLNVSLSTTSKRWYLALFLMGMAHSAAANISISPVVIDKIASDKHQYADLALHSTSPENEFVKVSISAITNPGLKNQSIVELDQVSERKKFGVYVSPDKFLLRPGATIKVRVGLLANTTSQPEDKVFRLKFLPVHADQSISKHRLIIAYGALVIVRPTQAKPELSAKQNGKHLLLMNKGNTNVFLMGVTQCAPHQTCKETLHKKRLYAHNSFAILLPASTPAQVLYHYRDRELKLNTEIS